MPYPHSLQALLLPSLLTTQTPLILLHKSSAETAMTLNGDLVTWSSATPIPVTMNVIAGSDDDRNLAILYSANRVGIGKIVTRDIITAIGTYPDGRSITLTNGKTGGGNGRQQYCQCRPVQVKALYFPNSKTKSRCNDMPLLRPKEITLTDIDGNDHKYLIGKIPLLAGGREVAAQYVLPTRVEPEKYEANQKLAEIMYKHTAAILEDGSQIILETKELVSNHIPDPVIATELEREVYEYNTGFSVTGQSTKASSKPCWSYCHSLNAETLMRLRDSSSPTTPPASTNSEPSIQ